MSYYLQGKRQADRWVYSPRMHVPWTVMCMNIRVHSYSPNFCSAMRDPLNESLLIFLSPVIYHLDCPSLITLEQLDNQNWQSIIEASLYFFSHIFAGGYGANPYQAIQGCYQQYQNNPQYQQQVYGWGGCHIGSCSGVASALSIKAKWAVF